ncbi:MAG: hypothetical protein ABL874_09285 [Sphingopyxis sp.]
MKRLCAAATAAGLILQSHGAVAQTAEPPATTATTVATPAATPPPPARLNPFDVDPASITVPDLSFTLTPEIASDFHKYFYFHRSDTDFNTALSDILECDAYARGLSGGQAGNVDMTSAIATYGIYGAAAGVLVGALAGAIFGSQAIRDQHRANLRTCMGYKGYGRYGLPKDIFTQFNSQDSSPGAMDAEQIALLRQQARIASGPRPQQEALAQ